ncbi:phosphotransferase [Alphaproteobacteria bacterium]|nr:phosphotransferase [Alphaproteobacteria bacterium]
MQYAQTQISQVMCQYVPGHSFSYERLSGGGNNVLWKVLFDGLPQFVIKDYGSDGSERLAREWAFLRKLAGNKISNVPVPIWIDRERKLACFSYLDGRKLQRRDITETHILQAANFIERLYRVHISGLPRAKGSHDTLVGHLTEIELRVSNLENLIEQHTTSSLLKAFVIGCLRPEWERRKQSIFNISGIDYFCSIYEFPSPSDFGFHNILCKKGEINCIDFEYAGIDDLAKLLADFSLTPEIPLSNAHNLLFRKIIISGLDVDRNFQKRLALLDFLFPIKWVCIILNVFIPEKLERILLASDSEMSKRQSEKLLLATQFFSRYKNMELFT